MKNNYGKLPKVIGRENIPHKYSTYILYMPIKMAKRNNIKMPQNLSFLDNFVKKCIKDYSKTQDVHDKYVYLSFETSYVEKGITQKRPGWHSDGFLTSDINYIWYSKYPTLFNTTSFKISEDHCISMEQFEKQALEENNVEYPAQSILRMDQYSIHKAKVPEKSSVRTFIKLSISKDKYNLKGNTKNPGFNYAWKMYERSEVRNHPQLKESDTVPEGFL